MDKTKETMLTQIELSTMVCHECDCDASVLWLHSKCHRNPDGLSDWRMMHDSAGATREDRLEGRFS